MAKQMRSSTCAVPRIGQDCDPDPADRFFFSKYRNPFIRSAVGLSPDVILTSARAEPLNKSWAPLTS